MPQSATTPASNVLRVVRMENPYAIGELEVIRQLSMWSSDQNKWLALAEGVKQGTMVVFCASSRMDRLEGFFILAMPADPLQDVPNVVHFQCQGGVKLKRKMVLELLAFIRQAGYTSYVAANTSGAPDELWLRAFRDGGPVLRKFTAFEFSTKQQVDHGRSRQGTVRRKHVRAAVHKHPNRRNAGRAEGAPRAVRGHTDKRPARRRKARV